MPSEKHIQKIIEHYAKEAKEEYPREFGEENLYDEITWMNIEPFLPDRGWILDAGGGEGFWSMKMAERFKSPVVLLDITPDALVAARKKIKNRLLGELIEFADADIRDIPYTENSFDFVLCEGDPIGICGNPERVVTELSRVLKPNKYLVAGVDSTLYRAFKALLQGKSIDYVLEFLQTEVSPAENRSLFDSRSFTPSEFMTLLKKHGLETINILGKPLDFSPDMTDVFVSALPLERRQQIFEDATERKKLVKILHWIYREPYAAAVGSHLHLVAVKTSGKQTVTGSIDEGHAPAGI